MTVGVGQRRRDPEPLGDGVDDDVHRGDEPRRLRRRAAGVVDHGLQRRRVHGRRGHDVQADPGAREQLGQRLGVEVRVGAECNDEVPVGQRVRRQLERRPDEDVGERRRRGRADGERGDVPDVGGPVGGGGRPQPARRGDGDLDAVGEVAHELDGRALNRREPVDVEVRPVVDDETDDNRARVDGGDRVGRCAIDLDHGVGRVEGGEPRRRDHVEDDRRRPGDVDEPHVDGPGRRRGRDDERQRQQSRCDHREPPPSAVRRTSACLLQCGCRRKRRRAEP